jgi:acyl-CoA reductase-like NAD-dependent aldehyde dehydrogenase
LVLRKHSENGNLRSEGAGVRRNPVWANGAYERAVQELLSDADLANVVECAVNGAYFATGQRCTASSGIIVEQPVDKRFAGALIERMRGLVVDDALEPETHIGPMVDATQLEQDLLRRDRPKRWGQTGGRRRTP